MSSLLSHNHTPSSQSSNWPGQIAVPRLVIIEDYQGLAEMVELMCVQHWGLEVVGMEQSGASGLNTVARTQPDLILLDIGLPDVDGLTLLPRLRAGSPGSKIIIFSSLFNDCVLEQLGDVEWDGLLDKVSDGLSCLREAIKLVCQGERYVSSSVRRLLALHRDSNNPFSQMPSEREREVLMCIARGRTDEEIATYFSIGKSTVHSHRKSLFKKLGQHSTPKLINYAIEHGYGTLPLTD